MGHQFGVPFHRELQSDIVQACLNLLSETSTTQVIQHFPKTWAEARREGKAIEQNMA